MVSPDFKVLCWSAPGKLGTDFYFDNWSDVGSYVAAGGDFCSPSWDPCVWDDFYGQVMAQTVAQIVQGNDGGCSESWTEHVLLFISEAWRGVQEGAAATADGIIPFRDPFEAVYRDESGNIEQVYMASRFCGNVARDALVGAAGAAFWAYVGAAEAPGYTTMNVVQKYLTNRQMAQTVMVNAVEFELGGTAATMYSGLSSAGGTIWTVIQIKEYHDLVCSD